MPKMVVLPHPEVCPDGKTFEAEKGMSICDNLLEHGIEIEHACEKSCARRAKLDPVSPPPATGSDPALPSSSRGTPPAAR